MQYDADRAKRWRKYVNAQASAAMLAQRDFVDWWTHTDRRDPEKLRDAAISKMSQLVYKYGLLASRAAADWYETERNAQIRGNYDAEMPDPLNTEQVEQAVRFAMGHYDFGGAFDADGRPRRSELLNWET